MINECGSLVGGTWRVLGWEEKVLGLAYPGWP